MFSPRGSLRGAFVNRKKARRINDALWKHTLRERYFWAGTNSTNPLVSLPSAGIRPTLSSLSLSTVVLYFAANSSTVISSVTSFGVDSPTTMSTDSSTTAAPLSAGTAGVEVALGVTCCAPEVSVDSPPARIRSSSLSCSLFWVDGCDTGVETGRLTGVAATDHIEAQGTLFYDMKNRCWARDLAELAGLDPSALPDLVNPTDLLGKVTARAAADMGIPEGTPVVCGTSDSAVEDYGAGAIEPGDCIVKLATAGNVNVMTAEAHPFPTTLTYSHVIPGMWYTVSATNAAALCQRWFRDLFCDGEKLEAEKEGINAFEILDRKAAESPLGANGVLFHPYLQGERSPYWDPDLRASFTGVAISSTKGDLIRALLEGVAFSLLDCYGLIREMKLPVKRIFLIGGGAKSRLWSEIVCNVFNLPVRVPIPGDASYGSALLAGTGIVSLPGMPAVHPFSLPHPSSSRWNFHIPSSLMAILVGVFEG